MHPPATPASQRRGGGGGWGGGRGRARGGGGGERGRCSIVDTASTCYSSFLIRTKGGTEAGERIRCTHLPPPPRTPRLAFPFYPPPPSPHPLGHSFTLSHLR
jgi:hypothetical protein